MRAGLATGGVVMGSIGSTRARNYTVVGDPVDLAARLEAANKALGTRILVAEATREAAGDLFAFRAVDILRVRGRSRPEPVFGSWRPTRPRTPPPPVSSSDSSWDWVPTEAATGTSPADPSDPASISPPRTVRAVSSCDASSSWSVTRHPRAGTAAGRSWTARTVPPAEQKQRTPRLIDPVAIATAHGRRALDERSLVLMAVGIPCEVVPAGGGMALLVAAEDAERASTSSQSL